MSQIGDTSLSLVVHVTDTDAPQQTATVTLSVVVTDVDDNTPAFTGAPYALTVSETAILGTSVGGSD